jgi:uncharacterized protein with HEPN domain
VTARSPVLRLFDILEAIEHIRSVLEDMTLDVFETDWQTQWLVERVSRLFRRQAGTCPMN